MYPITVFAVLTNFVQNNLQQEEEAYIFEIIYSCLYVYHLSRQHILSNIVNGKLESYMSYVFVLDMYILCVFGFQSSL